MSKVCAVCGKGPRAGNKVSHSNKKSSRWWKPNLQRVRVEIDGVVKTIRVCTKCLKSGKVKRVV